MSQAFGKTSQALMVLNLIANKLGFSRRGSQKLKFKGTSRIDGEVIEFCKILFRIGKGFKNILFADIGTQQ